MGWYIMKKIISIIVSFCLLLSISSICFADENPENPTDAIVNSESDEVIIEDLEPRSSGSEEPDKNANADNEESVGVDAPITTENGFSNGNEKENGDSVLAGKIESKNISQLKSSSNSGVVYWLDSITIDNIDNFDGSSVYLYTVDISLYLDESDDNQKNIVFGVYDEYTNEPVEEMRLKKDYIGWISVGNKELEKGKNYYVQVYCDSYDYSYNVKYTKEVYSGYSTSVSIDSYVSIQTGKSKDLTTRFYPNNTYSALTWKSSNETIATVDGMGTVYAKKAGTCNITATTQDGYTAICKVTVNNPAPYLNYKSKNIYRGSSFSLKLKYPLGKVTYKSTNKKIATVSSKGVVKGKKLGTCTIKVKSKGKTYNCKVKVVRANPNFGAVLYDYNTRSNKFVVKVKNWGSKPLYIKKGTGKVVDVDYKSFDRKVKLSKTVKIKPKSSKTLYFKVQGRTTWYDYSDFTLFYNFTYDGKKYTWHVWDEDSVLKKNKKWYGTYWDDDKYYDYFW